MIPVGPLNHLLSKRSRGHDPREPPAITLRCGTALPHIASGLPKKTTLPRLRADLREGEVSCVASTPRSATRDRFFARPNVASGTAGDDHVPSPGRIATVRSSTSLLLFRAFLKEAIDRFDKRRDVLWLPQEHIRSRFAGGSLYRTRRQHYHRCGTAVVQFTSALYDL